MVQKASRIPTRVDRMVQQQADIRTLFGLSRLRFIPKQTQKPAGGGNASPTEIGDIGGNWLNVAGGVMKGPVAFNPALVTKDPIFNFIDVAIDAGTNPPDDYSSNVLMSGADGDLQFIDGAAFSGQYLILQGTNQVDFTIKTSQIFTIDTISGDGATQIITCETDDPNGFVLGEIIQIDNTTNFNARAAITAINSATEFEYDLGSVGSATPETAGTAKNGNIITGDGVDVRLNGKINDFNVPNVTLVFDPTAVGNGAWRVEAQSNAGAGGGAFVPVGSLDRDHLEWNNSLLQWEAQQFFEFVDGASIPPLGLLRFPNNTIALAFRNSADDGDVEIKLAINNFLDITNNAEDPAGINLRTQHPSDPDNSISLSIGSGASATGLIDSSTVDFTLGVGGVSSVLINTLVNTIFTVNSPTGSVQSGIFNDLIPQPASYLIGDWFARGRNDIAGELIFNRIRHIVQDPTAGGEFSDMDFAVRENGTLVNYLELDSTNLVVDIKKDIRMTGPNNAIFFDTGRLEDLEFINFEQPATDLLIPTPSSGFRNVYYSQSENAMVAEDSAGTKHNLEEASRRDSAIFAKVVKTADQDNQSTTFVFDDELSFLPDINTQYSFRLVLIVNSGSTADINTRFDIPSGTVGTISDANIESLDAQTTSSIIASLTHATTGSDEILVFEGSILSGSTTGRVTLEFAQNVFDPSPTLIRAGSYIVVYSSGEFIQSEPVGGLTDRKVVKTADEFVTNSTVLQEDDELFFPMLSNTTYSFQLDLFFISNIANLETIWSLPGGAGGIVTTGTFSSGGSGIMQDITLSQSHGTSSGDRHLIFQGTIRNGSVAGLARFLWAQSLANVASTVVAKGSTLLVWKEGTKGPIQFDNFRENILDFSFPAKQIRTFRNDGVPGTPTGATIKNPFFWKLWQIVIGPRITTPVNDAAKPNRLAINGNIFTNGRRQSDGNSFTVATYDSPTALSGSWATDDSTSENRTLPDFRDRTLIGALDDLFTEERFYGMGTHSGNPDSGGFEATEWELQEIKLRYGLMLPARYTLVQLIDNP